MTIQAVDIVKGTLVNLAVEYYLHAWMEERPPSNDEVRRKLEALLSRFDERLQQALQIDQTLIDLVLSHL